MFLFLWFITRHLVRDSPRMFVAFASSPPRVVVVPVEAARTNETRRRDETEEIQGY